MIDNNLSNVLAAFEMLLEEVEAEVEISHKAETSAVEKRDYDSAREAKERMDQATNFREKIASLRKEWETLTIAQRGIIVKEILPIKQPGSRRLQRGIRTSESAYYQPILRALNELGGSAKMNDVVDRVEQFMKEVLKPEDYEPLASDTKTPRWRNTAAWARNEMVKEGLLKSTSKRGIWEISEAGRASLTKRNS